MEFTKVLVLVVNGRTTPMEDFNWIREPELPAIPSTSEAWPPYWEFRDGRSDNGVFVRPPPQPDSTEGPKGEPESGSF